MLKTATKISLASALHRLVMAARRLVGRDNWTVVRRGGIEWHIDLQEGIDFSIFVLGAFEPLTQREFAHDIGTGSIVIDIGANIGAHTLPLAKLVGDTGRVVAVEPTDFAFRKLCDNAARNVALRPRIDAHQLMLVNGDAETLPGAIYSSWPLVEVDDLHSEHKGRLMSTVGAKTATLDGLVEQCGLSRIDAIKLDVDGHEFSVLGGGVRTLERHRPVIFMELAPYVYSRLEDFDALVDLLRRYGYRFYGIPGRQSIAADAEAIRATIPVGGSVNIVAKVDGTAESAHASANA